MKIAVTSTDRKHVDTHFGKADTVYVFHIDRSGIKYLEKREIEKYCSDNPLHAFRAKEFDKVYEVIADCEALYTQKIGVIPARMCRVLGLKVFQTEGEILSVVKT
ncbi:MAG: NifB/NifX family molybdenum-iron cluster-binding protein [Bacteroidales bacterium]|jgi:predicted Fe-Mo cluster-binding NifX family protein